MKANLKGQGGVKGILLLHGEKFGMAIVGICVIIFLYSSLSQERLGDDFRADSLQQKIRDAKEEVERYHWEQAPDKRVAQPLADVTDTAVRPDAYSIAPLGWNPPVMPPTVMRTDPLILTAEDVKAYGGSGLLAFNDEQARQQQALALEAERVREEQARQKEQATERAQAGPEPRRGRTDPTGVGQLRQRPVPSGVEPQGVPLGDGERVAPAYWACVVAKVPVRDQLRLYRDAFQNARGPYDPTKDFPAYAGFFVQRAEVRPGQPLQWERVEVYDGQGHRIESGMAAKIHAAIAKDWAAVPDEIVDPRYLDDQQAMVFPLPPLVGRDWGQEVTHPDIPLASDAAQLSDSHDNAPQAEAETQDAGNSEDLFSSVNERTTGASARYRQRSLARGQQGSGAYGTVGGARTGQGSGTRGSRVALPPGVTHWLLRFFDFSVEPGKKYEYQVQLVLADPNQDPRLSQTSLDLTVLKRIEKDAKAMGRPTWPYRLTKWSEPSTPVGIPHAGSVRVAEAKLPSDKVFNDEPRVKLLVDSFDVDQNGKATAAQKEREFRRGYIANMKDDAEVLVDENRYIEPISSFKFHTGITVLDIRGGERLSRDDVQPASVLLMSPTGQLSVRRERDDASDVERFRAIFAQDTRRPTRGSPADGRFPGRGGSPTRPRGGGFEENFR